MIEYVCQKCSIQCQVPDDWKRRTFCGECAQEIASKLELITPKPPLAITYEQGVHILDVLQTELYGSLPVRLSREPSKAISVSENTVIIDGPEWPIGEERQKWVLLNAIRLLQKQRGYKMPPL